MLGAIGWLGPRADGSLPAGQQIASTDVPQENLKTVSVQDAKGSSSVYRDEVEIVRDSLLHSIDNKFVENLESDSSADKEKTKLSTGSNIINQSCKLDLLQEKVQSEEEVEVSHQSSLPKKVLAQEVPRSSMSSPKNLVASIEESTVTDTEIVTPLKSALSPCVARPSSPIPVMPTLVLSISSTFQPVCHSEKSLQLKLDVPTPSPRPPPSPPRLLSLQGLKPTELPNQTQSPFQQLASSKLMGAPPPHPPPPFLI